MLLYKFRSIEHLEFLSDVLVSQRLHCARYDELNDPFEGVVSSVFTFGSRKRAYSFTTVEDVLDPEDGVEPRVCSLSNGFQDIRLWSHYGGGHRGVAIEIDFSGFEKDLVAVTYGPTLRQFDEDAGDHPSLQAMLSYKTNHWEFEREYRILSSGPYYAVDGRIRRVIVGTRCTKADRMLLGRLVSGGTTLADADLNHKTVEVEVKASRTVASSAPTVQKSNG